jgi:hypothetical protein
MVEEHAAMEVSDRGGTPVHGQLRPVEMAQPGENDTQG